MRKITPDKPSTAKTATLIDDSFAQVARALKVGVTGPAAFKILRRLLNSNYDSVDTGEGYTELSSFGVPTGTPCCDFSRELRAVVSAATGSEHVLAPGVVVVLEW